MSNVIHFNGGGREVGDGLVIDPKAVLDGARDLKTVVVLGLDEDGDLYCASSHGKPDAFVLCNRAAKRLLDAIDAE